MVAVNIIGITVVRNLGLKDTHWEYSIYTKNKLENFGFQQSDAASWLPISPTIPLLYYCDKM